MEQEQLDARNQIAAIEAVNQLVQNCAQSVAQAQVGVEQAVASGDPAAVEQAQAVLAQCIENYNAAVAQQQLMTGGGGE